MKSVVSSISLMLAVLHFVGTISTESAQAKAIIPTPDIAGINSVAQDDLLLAQTVELPHLRALDQEKINRAVALIEHRWEKGYEDYFQRNFSDEVMTLQKIADTLGNVAVQTGKKPALLYIVPRSQQLELILITPTGQPIHKRVLAANQEALLEQAKELTSGIVNPIYRNTNRYLPAAQQLYQWIIAPLEADLQDQNIDTLLFCVGAGLRTLPFAALHDGQQFLVEKYSFSRIPAFKLTSTIYTDLRKAQVLAMGASEFEDLNPLPAVPAELSTITKDLWQGKAFLNKEFTVENLEKQRQQESFKIIHLATHAAFQPGSLSNSFIQFWDEKVTLDRMSELGWNNPPVELLVLSACETAIGDKDAELGFAGLAVQANVKSAIATLWSVSDEGTLGLIGEFYQELQTASTKAEALRQAQITMIRGQVRLEEGHLHTSTRAISLPPALAEVKNENLSHPYYWAAFTVVGSPW